MEQRGTGLTKRKSKITHIGDFWELSLEVDRNMRRGQKVRRRMR